MSHFAQVNESGTILRVVVGVDDAEAAYQWLRNNLGGTWIRTWYDARARDPAAAYRYNFAEIGGQYDTARNAFIPYKRYTSWVLDETTCTWVSPIAYPDDGGRYEWDEESLNWNPL